MTSLGEGSLLRNRYQIVRALGSGGVGTAYLADDTEADRRVVVKALRRPDDHSRSLMLREARLLQRVASPAVPQLFDFFLEGDDVYLVQQYIAGAPFQEWRTRRWLYEVVELFENLAHGLATIHEHDLVHRDLKPSNVLVVDDETGGARAFILDFGVAVVTDEPDQLTRPSSTIVGTPRYMAPEVLRGEAAGPAVDMFAFGTMLYEATVGASPWQATGAFQELAKSIVAGLSDDAKKALEEGVPWKLGKVIAELLDLTPSDRPSAQDTAAALREVANELTRPAPEMIAPPTAPVPSPLTAPAPPSDGPDTETTLTMPRTALSRRWRPSWPMLGLVFVGAVVGATLLALARAYSRTAPLSGEVGDGTPVSLIPIVVGIAFGLSATLGAYALRRREVAQASSGAIETRVQAIEASLAEVGTVSETLVAQFEDLQTRFDPARLVEQLSQTVVATMRDMQPGASADDAGRLVAALKAAFPKQRDDTPAPWHKRASTWVGFAGATITLVTAGIGFADAMDLWSPNQRPEILRFGPETTRALRSVPLELNVVAQDADGDELSYQYEASSGTVEAHGALLLWRADPDVPDAIVELRVRVSDGTVAIEQSRSVRINAPPAVSLVGPDGINGGDAPLRLRVEGADPDGDDLTFAWQTSCGTLDRTDGDQVFLRAEEPCTAYIRCRVNDGWESVDLEAQVPVG